MFVKEKIIIKQKISYPFQVASLKQEKNGEKKTLGIDARLAPPNAESETEKAMPLEMHSGYSRFVATLIKKTEKGADFVKGNIPADEVGYIFEKTKEAMSLMCLTKNKPQKQAASPAYTERFTLGTLKGKTPAEILLENKDNKKSLLSQKEFLAKNADKFPANKKLMAAIDDAISLLDNGKLKPGIEPASSVVIIYDEQTKPLLSTKDENDKYLVYGIRILCDTSRNLPFSFEIANCRAPLNIAENKKLNVRMSEATDNKRFVMNLSEKDWFKVIDRMNSSVKEFENLVFKKMYLIAKTAEFENRKNAKESTDDN